jgi:CubicO group peptidase (beta-lactamase class C family)
MPATVAALQQVEKGTLDLQAPVADYCPEFAEVQVLAGFDGETPRLRPPARQATVRNLITHTSGPGLLVLERGPGPLGEGDRHPERRGRVEHVLQRPAAERSG